MGPRTFKLNNYTFYAGAGKQAELLKVLKQDERLLMLQDDYRTFYRGIVKTCDLLHLCSKYNFNICEILTNFPHRVYFDIDGSSDLQLDTVKNIITKYFGDVKMYVMGYEAPDKHSYHITLNKYVTSVEDRLFLRDIVTEIKKSECEYFDSVVYGNNRAMKCIGQSKPDGHKQLGITTNNDNKFFIGSFLPDVTRSFNSSKLPDISKNLKNIVKTYSKQTLDLPTEITNEHMTKAIELLKLTPINKSIDTQGYRWEVIRFCYHNGLSLNTFLNWYSPMKPSTQRSDKLKAMWNDKLALMTMKQFRRKLSQFYPDMIEDNIHTSKFISMFDLTKYNSESIGRITPAHYEVPNKALVFNIGMGGGKTTTTLEYLQRHNDKSFVWLAPRQTLVLNTSFRMKNEFKIDHVTHLDAVEKRNKGSMLKTAERLIICNQSLHYLGRNQEFKIVVIDEIETVINSWKDDETHKENLGHNFKTFVEILQKAEKIILLDAFTTKKTFSLLESLGITDVKLYSSEYRPIQKTLKHYPDQDLLVKQICDEIAAGKKLYIFYAFKNGTSKRMGIQQLDERIKGYVEGKTGTAPSSILYFAESTAKNQLGNINESWAKANYIITTSSITVGVNYEGKDFDKVYLFCSGYANQPRDVIQSSMRVRYPKDPEFGIYFFDNTNEEMTSYPAYYLEKKCSIYNRMIDGVIDELQCDFNDSLRKFCELTNYQLGDVKKVMNKKTNITNEYFESKMLLEYSKVPVYTMLSADVAEGHVYDRTATLEERLALDRFYFDYNFKDYTEEDRSYIWNENQRKFFKNIRHPFILMLESANGCPLYEININDMKTSEEVITYVTFNYKHAKKSNINLIITKVINDILGGMIKVKRGKTNIHKGFEWVDEFGINVKIMLSVELAKAKSSIVPYVKSDLDEGIDMIVDENDADQRYKVLKAYYDRTYHVVTI